MNAWKHLCTINHHKKLVMKGCFQLGLIKQGLLHDLSKYSPVEFWVGAKYYQGTQSPNNAERKDRGYSSAWLHHKGRNKHHLEYWIDYAGSETDTGHNGMTGMKMPINYVVEMFVDRVSASKNYQKDAYKDDSPIKYYARGKGVYIIHKDTEALLEYLLTMLAVRGEKETFAFIKQEVLKGKVPYEKDELDARKDALHFQG